MFSNETTYSLENINNELKRRETCVRKKIEIILLLAVETEIIDSYFSINEVAYKTYQEYYYGRKIIIVILLIKHLDENNNYLLPKEKFNYYYRRTMNKITVLSLRTISVIFYNTTKYGRRLQTALSYRFCYPTTMKHLFRCAWLCSLFTT